MIEHFPLLDSSNSHYQQPFCPYSFVDRSSSYLVVTVGASWTWGNFLPINFDQTQATDQQHAYRKKHIYGNIVSQALDADFLNLGGNGMGNFWEADLLNKFCQLLPTLDYKKILVIWTTTDPGKGFNEPEDRDMDYIKSIQNANSFNDVLADMNRYAVNKFADQLLSDKRVIFRTGSDCVTPIGFEQLESFMLPSPWLSQCRETRKYQRDAYVITRYVIDRLTGLTEFFDKNTDQDKFKQWIIDMIDRAESVLELWELPVFQTMFPNLHPVESANRQWANIILQTL